MDGGGMTKSNQVVGTDTEKDVPEMRWYGVKCVFQFSVAAEAPGHTIYEERVTIWSAPSSEKAIEKAEAEAREYAGEDGEYLDYCVAFEMFDDPSVAGAEVYSLMREDPRDPADYLDRFYDTGRERYRRMG
jgi:hypothetical protein